MSAMVTKTFTYKGSKLVPLTPEVARTLDKGDQIKYIGSQSPEGYRDNIYYLWRRRVLILQAKPEVFPRKICLTYYGMKYVCKIEDLALVERGDRDAGALRHAARFIPINLKSFKRKISEVILQTQENIDSYLNELPLHKKLELFKKLTPEEKVIYDCLYKDIEVLIGLKEEDNAPEPSGT